LARRFEIRVGTEAAIAELLEREAPGICAALWSRLPVEGFCVHAKFAGDELIVMLPFFAEAENEIFDVAPGDIGYYPGRQTACMFYGRTQPFGYVSVFARVVANLEMFRSWGQRILEGGSLPMTLTVAG